MKFLVVYLLLAIVFSVDALWSSKCKEAETSADKVVRLIQNVNCTLQEKSNKLRENFNNLRQGLRGKLEGFKGMFSKNKNMSEYEGLDHNIDVRTFRDYDKVSFDDVDDEIETTTTTAAIYERTKRDDDENEEQKEEEEAEVEEITAEASNDFIETTEVSIDFDDTTMEPSNEELQSNAQGYRVLLAPNTCRPGQKFTAGRCRTIV